MRTIFLVLRVAGAAPTAASYHLPANQSLIETVQMMLALLRTQNPEHDFGSPDTYALYDIYSETLDPRLLVRQVPFPGVLVVVSRDLEVKVGEETRTGEDAAATVAHSISMQLMAQREDEEDRVSQKYARFINSGAWRYEPTPITSADVGLTYHEDDSGAGSRLLASLRERGLRCAARVAMRDGASTGVDAGGSPADGARALVVLISQATQDEPWLAHDIGAAWALGLPVVPVLVGAWTAEPPDILAPYQRLNWDTQQERVVHDLVELLDLTPWSIPVTEAPANETPASEKPATKRKKPSKKQ